MVKGKKKTDRRSDDGHKRNDDSHKERKAAKKEKKRLSSSVLFVGHEEADRHDEVGGDVIPSTSAASSGSSRYISSGVSALGFSQLKIGEMSESYEDRLLQESIAEEVIVEWVGQK
jgi:hypothetical protein